MTQHHGPVQEPDSQPVCKKSRTDYSRYGYSANGECEHHGFFIDPSGQARGIRKGEYDHWGNHLPCTDIFYRHVAGKFTFSSVPKKTLSKARNSAIVSVKRRRNYVPDFPSIKSFDSPPVTDAYVKPFQFRMPGKDDFSCEKQRGRFVCTVQVSIWSCNGPG